jgi:hypothetical protein
MLLGKRRCKYNMFEIQINKKKKKGNGENNSENSLASSEFAKDTEIFGVNPLPPCTEERGGHLEE